MKKLLIASGVAVLALTSVVAAQTFSTNLTVGSTGADVVALQTWLVANGFNIPAVSSGAAAKGYFGSQTQSAVKLYQASKGIPNTGFVGPLTRAALNAGGAVAVAPAVGCPVGYTCTPTPGTAVTPVNPGTPLVMDGTDGSLTVSLSSYASNVTAKKGETKDMVAVKLQATAAPVSVTRFDVRFNTRPWLYFSTITLKDSNGAVIATKNLVGPADATEITVGTDYLVRFEGINAIVTPGTDRILVVSGSVLSTTDKLSSDVSVIVSVPTGSIRTINGKGYTDSLGLGTVAVSGTTGRTVTLSSSGSTGNILARISPNTPATRIVTTSTNGETTGVILGKFDLKSENRSSTINTLKFSLKDNGGNKDWATIIKRLYVSDGTQTVQVDAVATSSVFSNLTFELPQDQWKTITLTADIADQDDFANGAMASTTLTVNTTNIVGIDSNFTTVTASGANVVATNESTFLQSGASVSNLVATAVLNDNGTSKSRAATIAFGFVFNNTGTSDLYISANPSVALATSSTISRATSTVFTAALVTTDPGTRAGDSGALTNSGYYVIPSGTSRGFLFSGTSNNADTDQTAGLNSTSVTRIYFDDDTTGLQEFSINFGLEKLQTPGLNY